MGSRDQICQTSEKWTIVDEEALIAGGVQFRPDGVVVLKPMWMLKSTLLNDRSDCIVRAFHALEKQASTDVKMSLDAWSNAFHLGQWSGKQPNGERNHKFLLELLKSEMLSAEHRIMTRHKVFDAVAKLQLSESPPPKFSPSEATSIVREVALAICLSYNELERLNTLTSKLFKKAWNDEYERRTLRPDFPRVLVPLRKRAETLDEYDEAEGGAWRVQTEMCFDIVAGFAVAALRREWVPFHLDLDDRLWVFEFYDANHRYSEVRRWGSRKYRLVQATDSYYKECVEKLDLLPEQKKTRNAALQMAMHCARKKAEDAATFAGDAAAEPGLAAFARLACSLGGGATGGPTAEKGLVPLILYQVQLLCEADYMASIVAYRHAVWKFASPFASKDEDE